MDKNFSIGGIEFTENFGNYFNQFAIICFFVFIFNNDITIKDKFNKALIIFFRFNENTYCDHCIFLKSLKFLSFLENNTTFERLRREFIDQYEKWFNSQWGNL